MASPQTHPRFDMRSRPGAQTKGLDPVSRFRWALSFPGIAPAAGKVLAALADHADQRKLTCFPSVETLARETQVSERGVRYALRKLESAGAILTERSNGRSSSLYRLMIPTTLQGLPRSTLQSVPPNPARIAPLNPARIAPLTELSLEQSKREQSKQQQERAHEASGEASDEAPTTPAAAAANPIDSSSSKSKNQRHTCPKCERTWPEHYGPVCFKCQCDVEHAQLHKEALAKMEEDIRLYEEAHRVSETAQKINGAGHGSLPDSWLYHQDLKTLIGNRDFKEVCDSVFRIGVRRLPEPEKFFADYSQHLQEHQRAQEEYKRRQAELPEIEDSLKAMKDALCGTR